VKLCSTIAAAVEAHAGQVDRVASHEVVTRQRHRGAAVVAGRIELLIRVNGVRRIANESIACRARSVQPHYLLAQFANVAFCGPPFGSPEPAYYPSAIDLWT
jgi:hypothetical protein